MLITLAVSILWSSGLSELWSYNVVGPVYGLAFSDDGLLGVASWDGKAYILDPRGRVLKIMKAYESLRDASYSSGKFAFVSHDNYVNITEKGTLVSKRYYVGPEMNEAVTVTDKGFMACWTKCAFYSFNGSALWDINSTWGVKNGPAYSSGYWYIADWDGEQLLIVKDGKLLNIIKYDEWSYDVAACGSRLAVTTSSNLYLYDLSDPTEPKELWKRGGFAEAYQLAFSPNCKYVAVVDVGKRELEVYGSDGKMLTRVSLESAPYSVAWWGDEIATGLENGKVIVFKFSASPVEESVGLRQEQGNGIVGVALASLLWPVIRKRLRQ